ncbi:hypothetical protein MUA13_13635 (plasmid) [Staphylococcus aureus]|uniref:hypothetical protein n=1 Tax=Staphylococcus aureus TaxID=1280 RepID=UPI0021D2B7C9|nr:hypothetical protein [Staphylococcus aureus]UXU27415.1 hypothetical protein MUA13_13635 [Staphylococcus aureus]
MKKAIVTLSSIALLVGFGSTSYVEANEVSNVKQVTQSSQETGSDIPDGISLENVDQQELTQFLTTVENIPDSVLAKGDKATNEYIQKENSNLTTSERGAVGCASAIGLAIASNAFSAAKIAKVKEVLKAAGGAKTFATKLVPAYKEARKTMSKKDAAVSAVKTAESAAGPQALSAAIGFFSVGQVYSECFE